MNHFLSTSGSYLPEPMDTDKRSSMNHKESLEFVRNYFAELFGKRNVDALDVYLDKDYFDDDIGDPNVDPIENSKEYLAELFRKQPTIGVDVKEVMTRDGVISAFLEWFIVENNLKKVLRKGIAIFVLRDQRIIKRHTFIYFQE
jgi:hypothetical protein